MSVESAIAIDHDEHRSVEYTSVRGILDAAVDAVVTIADCGQITYFNAAAAAMFGYRAEEVLGHNVSLLLPAPYAAAHDSYLERYLRDGQPRVIGIGRNAEARRKDGRLLHVYLAVCEVWQNGQRTFTAFLHDLSAHQEAERCTEELAAFTRENPHPVVRVAANGYVRYANAAGHELLGSWNCDDGRCLPEPLTEIVQLALDNGETPDVTFADNQRTVALRLCPNPALNYVTLYGHDVTERVRAENQVRENEAALQAIFQSAADCIMLVSPEGLVETVNPAAENLFGYEHAEFNFRPLTEVMATANGGELLPAIVASCRQEDRRAIHMIGRRKDGKRLDLECAVSSASRLARQAFTLVLRDVSDRKRLERERQTLNEQLVQAARQSGQFEVASSVLHNVGNVLNSINASVAMLTEQMQTSEVPHLTQALQTLDQESLDLSRFLHTDPRGQLLRPYLRAATTQLCREQETARAELQHLAKHLDHVKHIIAAQQKYAKGADLIASVSLPDVIDDALRIGDALRAKAIVCIARNYGVTDPIRTDKHLLLQILVNLVKNAFDALAAAQSTEKHLVITLSAVQGGACITVADNGIGIAAENLTRIFSHGFTTKPEGHGFGLHSAALAAKQLGGNLVVQSRGAGQGAVFSLSLPALLSTEGN